MGSAMCHLLGRHYLWSGSKFKVSWSELVMSILKSMNNSKKGDQRFPTFLGRFMVFQKHKEGIYNFISSISDIYSSVLIFHIIQTVVIKINSRSMSFELNMCLGKESNLASEVASSEELIANLVNCYSCQKFSLYCYSKFSVQPPASKSHYMFCLPE